MVTVTTPKMPNALAPAPVAPAPQTRYPDDAALNLDDTTLALRSAPTQRLSPRKKPQPLPQTTPAAVRATPTPARMKRTAVDSARPSKRARADVETPAAAPDMKADAASHAARQKRKADAELAAPQVHMCVCACVHRVTGFDVGCEMLLHAHDTPHALQLTKKRSAIRTRTARK